MKLWKLKYTGRMVKTIEDLKDNITSPTGILVFRAIGVAIVVWIIYKVVTQ